MAASGTAPRARTRKRHVPRITQTGRYFCTEANGLQPSAAHAVSAKPQREPGRVLLAFGHLAVRPPGAPRVRGPRPSHRREGSSGCPPQAPPFQRLGRGAYLLRGPDAGGPPSLRRRGSLSPQSHPHVQPCARPPCARPETPSARAGGCSPHAHWGAAPRVAASPPQRHAAPSSRPQPEGGVSRGAQTPSFDGLGSGERLRAAFVPGPGPWTRQDSPAEGPRVTRR